MLKAAMALRVHSFLQSSNVFFNHEYAVARDYSIAKPKLTFLSAIFSRSHSENLTRLSLSQVAPMLQMRAKMNQGSINSFTRASCSSLIGFSP